MAIRSSISNDYLKFFLFGVRPALIYNRRLEQPAYIVHETDMAKTLASGILPVPDVFTSLTKSQILFFWKRFTPHGP